METKSKNMKYTDLKDMLKQTGEVYGDRPAYIFKTEEKGKFRTITHKEFRENINALGTTLIQMGLKDKRIAVISENRYEWELSYLAVAAGVGVIVPLDKALPDNELESLILRSQVEAIIYSILIILPEITNTAFSSYIGNNKGTVGWFYAANEIGAIMVALFPFLYYLLFEREGVVKIALTFTIVILAMTLLGTKTSFLGMLITEVIYALYFLFNYKKNRAYGLKISLIIIKALGSILLTNFLRVTTCFFETTTSKTFFSLPLYSPLPFKIVAPLCNSSEIEFPISSYLSEIIVKDEDVFIPSTIISLTFTII